MGTRRAFLESFGLSLGALGLPGVAQAWGRRFGRRNCGYAAPVAECRPTYGDWMCLQSRTQINGIWHYGALDWTLNCSSSSVSSQNEYDLVTGCPANHVGCLSWSYRRPWSPRSVIPHEVDGTPGLDQPLDPSNIQYENTVGEVVLLCSQKARIKVKRGGKDELRSILLMLLYMVPPEGNCSAASVVPVGQEVKPHNADEIPVESQAGTYCTVLQGSIRHHVFVVK